MKKKFPDLASDAEAERFVDEADLSDYDFSAFKPMRFELEPKSKSVTMRLPQSLFDALKARAEQQKIPYQRLIRLAIEKEIARHSK